MVTGGHLPERGQFSTARGAPSGIKTLQKACESEITSTQQNILQDAYPIAVVTPLLESPAMGLQTHVSPLLPEACRGCLVQFRDLSLSPGRERSETSGRAVTAHKGHFSYVQASNSSLSPRQ